MKAKLTKKTSLEQDFTMLETIVAEFESGNLNLEQAIPRFKQGIELAKKLKKRLTIMENEIKQI